MAAVNVGRGSRSFLHRTPEWAPIDSRAQAYPRCGEESCSPHSMKPKSLSRHKTQRPEVLETTGRLKLNWPTILVMVLLHTGPIAALFIFSWQRALVAFVFYWITICVGISMVYHRLHAHTSYKMPLVLEYFLADFWIVDASRPPDFLGRNSPHAPSEYGPAGGPALASGAPLGGRRPMAHLRRGESQ